MAMSNKEGIDGQKSEIIYTCFFFFFLVDRQIICTCLIRFRSARQNSD